MGATRNTGYLENLIQYDASDNVAIATSVNPSYKVTLGGSLLGTSAVFSSSVSLNTSLTVTGTNSTAANNTITGYSADLYALAVRQKGASAGISGTNFMAQIISAVGAEGLEIYTPNAKALVFGTGATERIRITSGGNVGIGDTTVNSRLFVKSDGATNGLSVKGAGNGGTYPFRVTWTNGTEGDMLCVNDAGRVGIGTTSPNNLLELSSATSGGSLRFSNSNNTAFYWDIGRDSVSTGDFLFRKASGGAASDMMRITNDGSVGIGVTPSGWGSGIRALQVAAYGSMSTTGGVDTQFSNNAYFDGTNWRYIASQEAANYYMNRDTHVWRYKSAGTAGNTITWNEAMRITSGGNVLIGTTTDNGRKLNVNGSGLFSGILSTRKVEMGDVQSVSINSGSTFTLLSSDKINIRTNILVSVSIYWDNNVNAQRQYLLFLGATNTNWGTPNSAITVVASNDWSSGYVGAATFSIGGSNDTRTLNISVSNAATYNVTAYARVLEM